MYLLPTIFCGWLQKYESGQNLKGGTHFGDLFGLQSGLGVSE